MKRVLLSVMMAITAVEMFAVPANPRPFVYTQPDGSRITLSLMGDEYAHSYVDENGFAVTINEDGFITRLTEKAEPLLRERRKTTLNERARLLGNLKNSINRTPGKDSHGLIILVNFDDLKFNNTREEIFNLMNQQGYNKNGATGSARDYFVAQSMAQFEPTFDVVGPVDLEMPYRYYGANDAKGSDKNASVMIFSAVQKAAEQGLVNLDDYDADKDGIVDMVYVIYAGLGEADGGDANTVWPHMWNLQASAQFANQQIQGKRVGLYACSAEYRTDQTTIDGKSFSGIGTFCHEYGHCLGLPDIYDVTYSGGYGMASWDIMSSGSYLNNGNTPPSYSAFERYSVGWLNYDDATVERDYVLSPLAESNHAVRLSSPTNPDEYFILENRQQNGWDAYLPARGLMITHIDYDEQVWDQNAVNADPKHQHVMMMAADNNWAKSTISGDLFPGLLNNTSFTDSSKPSSLLWDGTPLGKSVTDIRMDGTDISFHVGIDASGIMSPYFENESHGQDIKTFSIDGKLIERQAKGIVIENGVKRIK